MKKIPVFTIFGLPGSGKSAQVVQIKKRFGFQSLSTGEVTREAAQRDPEIKRLYRAGGFLADRLIKDLIIERLNRIKIEKGFIFDNYPINRTQMEYWRKKIKDRYNFKSLWGIHLAIEPDKIIKRLAKRLYCPRCHQTFKPGDLGYKERKCPKDHSELIKRDDDKPEVIRERIKRYQKPTEYLRKYFKKRNHIIEVNADQSIGKIAQEITEKIRKIDD